MAREKRGVQAKTRLLQLAQLLGNVSEACRIAGFSRDSFYRFKRLYEKGGTGALVAPARLKAVVRNRVRPKTERAILELARTHPSYGRVRVAKILHKRGLTISPSGVRLVWLWWGLETAPKRRRLSAESERIEQAGEEKSYDDSVLLFGNTPTCTTIP